MIKTHHLIWLLSLTLLISCTHSKKLVTTPKTEITVKPLKKEIVPQPLPKEMIHSDIADQEVILGSLWKTYYIVPNPSKSKTISRSFNGSRICYIQHEKHGVSIISTLAKKLKNTPDTVKIQTKTEAGEANMTYKLKVIKQVSSIQYAATPLQLTRAIQEHKNQRTQHTIFLNTGNFGDYKMENQSNITIIPALGQNPTFSSITIENSNNINILSLDILGEKKEGKNAFYVKIDKNSSNIKVANCHIRASYETETWTPEDWATKAANGIFSEADNCIFSNNLIQHIHHGIETKGDNCQVTNNIIIRFAGDAIRNTGNNNVFDSNYMADALVDDYAEKGGNHDDLFQAWTFDKPISNLVIKNNIAINCTDTTNHLQSKNVQGIACFDGFEENWLIENNLVILEHPHGIALFGANNCEIKNNKIIYNPFNKYHFESLPWIMIHAHKDGRKSHNNLIINNLTSVIEVKNKDAATIKNNTITSKPFTKYFQDYQNWIFNTK